ncbi:hypothetical protein GCM10023085_27410 [Actinomadura viridis]|uniref:Hint domain-containing protein n=1 Tax=Actinomadura viridis TaxID=58110 RepID=A0A931GHC4_9ACTN|nr:RNase A-like domain-containing protein [Actinomadura viridis]MBG6087273.1 hypothetical protein [Actinomadura viridis]
MLRRLGDRGEGSLSYIGVILLIAAVAGAVTVVAIPEQVTASIRSAVCMVTRDNDCEDGRPGATPSGGTPSGGPSSAPATPQVSGSPVGETPEERELREARAAAGKADQDAQSLENEWANFDLLKEIGALGLDFIAGDIINCVKKPNFGDCAWALIGLVPWGKIGKLLKAIPKVIKLVDRFLDLKRRLDKARAARKAAKSRLDDAIEACRKKQPQPNSFPPGTPVLMADGSRRPIEKVRVGDRVHAADPETGRAGVRTVTDRIVGEGRKRLVDLTVDLDGRLGGPTATLTATSGHPFWVAGTDDWIDGGRLVFGDTLVTPGGGTVMVLKSRRYERAQKVYNLTVDDLETYYVAAGSLNLLVHNCRDLDKHEEPQPPPRPADPLRQGHTLKDHVNATDDELLRHAQAPNNPSNRASRWANRQKAEEVIDHALDDPANQQKIQNWLAKVGKGQAKDTFELRGRFGDGSLGDVMLSDGTKKAAGNGYRIVLKRAKGHKPGWYVYTAYPE